MCSILQHAFIHMRGKVVIYQKFYELQALRPPPPFYLLLLLLHTSFAICEVSGALETLMPANLPF